MQDEFIFSHKENSIVNIPLFQPLPQRKGITLHNYQLETVAAFKTWFYSADPEALIALATGLGKTLTASACVDWTVLTTQGNVLWITHRDELIQQSAEALEEYVGLPVAVEQAQLHTSPSSHVNIIVASVQSLKGQRLRQLALWYKPQLIVFDEAHHSQARTWLDIKQQFIQAKVLNLTATPYRQDIANRLDLGKVLIEKSTSDGIEGNFLVPPQLIGTVKLNLDGVKIRLGDYQIESLTAALTRPPILQSCVEAITPHLKGRRALIFAASIDHGHKIAESLEEAGYHSYQIYGDTPKAQRQAYYKDVRENTDRILICNLVLTEGFNLPEIDLVVMLRPTRNAALFIQCIGRGLRTAKNKKECLIIDAIDIKKSKNKGIKLHLPTETEIKQFRAMKGAQYQDIHVFLSWFYHEDDLETYQETKVLPNPRKELNNASTLFHALMPRMRDHWLEEHIHKITDAQELLLSNQPDSLESLFAITGTRHVEVFVRSLYDSGWLYCEHGLVPQTSPELEDLQEKLETELQKNDNPLYSFTIFAETDPKLKHFLMDVLGQQNLTKQSEQYFEVHVIEGHPTAWFKAIGIMINFCFIQAYDEILHINQFWVKSHKTGLYYLFDQKTSAPVTLRKVLSDNFYEELPDFVKGLSWAKASMTDKQRSHIQRILSVAPEDLKKLKISKLSASALMSSTYNKDILVRIQQQLLILEKKVLII